MLTFIKGNIFYSKVQTLTVPVNTFGTMGAGLALSFKKRFNGLDKFYKSKCLSGELKVGKLVLYNGSPYQNILLFPTKINWKNKSLASYIDLGLESFVNSYKSFGIESIAFPALGCGLGELSWELIKQKMELWLYNVEIPIEIYEPN